MKFTRLLTMLLGALCVGCNAQNPNVTVVEPTEFKAMIEQDRNAVLLDVRKPEEYAEGHLKGARIMNWLDEELFKQEAATLDGWKTILYVLPQWA